MNFGSLRLRLLIAGALSVALALALAGMGLVFLFERHVERRLDDELSVYLNQLTSHLEPGENGGLAVSGDLGEPRFETPLSGLYWQIDTGTAWHVLRSRSLWDAELALPKDDGVGGTVRHHTIEGPGGSRLYLAQRHIDLPPRLGHGTVRIAVARDAASIGTTVAEFTKELALLLSFIGLLLIAAAWVQVSIGLRPLDAVRGRLAAMRSGRGTASWLGVSGGGSTACAGDRQSARRARRRYREGARPRRGSRTWSTHATASAQQRDRAATPQRAKGRRR